MSWPLFLPWNDSRETQAAFNEFRSSRRQQAAVCGDLAVCESQNWSYASRFIEGLSLERAGLKHKQEDSAPCRRLPTKVRAMLERCNANLHALKYSAFTLRASSARK